MELVVESALVKHKVNAIKNLMNPSTKLNHGMFNRPLMNSALEVDEASEAMNGCPNQSRQQ